MTEFGIFAEIDNFYISGLVHVSDLPGDRYIFDKISGILKGRRTGKSFRQGQNIIVKIAGCRAACFDRVAGQDSVEAGIILT